MSCKTVFGGEGEQSDPLPVVVRTLDMNLPLLPSPGMFKVMNVTSRSFDVEFEYPFFLEGQTVSEFVIEYEEHSATIGHDATPLDSIKRKIHVTAPKWPKWWTL